MRRAIAILVLLFGSAAIPGPLRAQQVVDRIVARIEDDILTLSEVRELGRFQQLVDGRNTSEDALLARLIDQWIVTAEAAAARFAAPGEADVAREAARLAQQFPSPEAYAARLREVGLGPAAVRRLVARQLHLSRYLDYKFRPAVQVEAAQIERYYHEELAPQLAARGELLPPLEKVEAQVRELLTQREINQRAARWLEESRARIRVEILREGEAK